ncbi:hypothetical protein CYCD_19190 [Tenuifilaceae bacterium CYCD]|nr:hypothetical protein CYCD_19190 [Tenuifilaceae bacterium CYCD]
MPMLSSRNKGIISTIAVHGILILLLMVLGFTTPLPLPAEQGILINFGTSDDGMGAMEPKVEQDASTSKSSSTLKQEEEESPLTQDTEEAPSLTVKKEEKKKQETSKIKETTKQENNSVTNKNQTEVESEKPREANKKALFPGQKVDGGNTGEGETGKQGNQGGEEGSPDSQNRIGSVGGGGDAEFGIAKLSGRTVANLISPAYPPQKKGTVVVEVTVDSQGNVTKAIPGVKGSTTLDSELLKAAETAAMKTRFDVRKNSQSDQIGTITYVFKLQ